MCQPPVLKHQRHLKANIYISVYFSRPSEWLTRYVEDSQEQRKLMSKFRRSVIMWISVYFDLSEPLCTKIFALNFILNSYQIVFYLNKGQKPSRGKDKEEICGISCCGVQESGGGRNKLSHQGNYYCHIHYMCFSHYWRTRRKAAYRQSYLWHPCVLLKCKSEIPQCWTQHGFPCFDCRFMLEEPVTFIWWCCKSLHVMEETTWWMEYNSITTKMITLYLSTNVITEPASAFSKMLLSFYCNNIPVNFNVIRRIRLQIKEWRQRWYNVYFRTGWSWMNRFTNE